MWAKMTGFSTTKGPKPFTAPTCKTSGLKSVHIHRVPAAVFDGRLSNRLSKLCILIELLSRTKPNAKGNRLKDLKLAVLLVIFRRCGGSERVNDVHVFTCSCPTGGGMGVGEGRS